MWRLKICEKFVSRWDFGGNYMGEVMTSCVKKEEEERYLNTYFEYKREYIGEDMHSWFFVLDTTSFS